MTLFFGNIMYFLYVKTYVVILFYFFLLLYKKSEDSLKNIVSFKKFLKSVSEYKENY